MPSARLLVNHTPWMRFRRKRPEQDVGAIITNQLQKFKPHEALGILLDTNRPTFWKTWALARFLGWMCRDQRSGRRRDHSNKPRFRSENAKLTGQMALASLLDRQLQSERGKKDIEALLEMLMLFRD